MPKPDWKNVCPYRNIPLATLPILPPLRRLSVPDYCKVKPKEIPVKIEIPSAPSSTKLQ